MRGRHSITVLAWTGVGVGLLATLADATSASAHPRGPEQGSVILPAGTPVGPNFADVIGGAPLRVRLPSTGIYRITADVRGRVQGIQCFVEARLYSTGGALPGSERLIVLQPAPEGTVNGPLPSEATGSITALVDGIAGQTVTVQARLGQRTLPIAFPPCDSGSVESDVAVGRSTLTWVRVD
jgi:hypothetical protein